MILETARQTAHALSREKGVHAALEHAARRIMQSRAIGDVTSECLWMTIGAELRLLARSVKYPGEMLH
jgi:hypothetical protein